MKKEKEFEKVLSQFMPMVYGVIHKWNLMREKEEYEQIGRIAIYEAWLKYDTAAGPFAPLAKSYIYGKIRHELTRQDKRKSRAYSLEPELLFNIADSQHSEEIVLLQQWILQLDLTPREKDWAAAYIIENLKPADIAVKYGVSVTTVKSWRKTALKKLRSGSMQECEPIL
ncbi:sigma-70 family RNA polymerase sigma factor [Alkalicoccus daliensis]|uniref:DNA-directed RNA polymerase n=1 Tax=Alkalicoccus daliensis TaxID=745820 RepID=A0A1H0J6T0_9BACI|nr:sigma-70 family RNA polymerase sigma factor [Alkalicoccus daliensis]SDO39061.1 DNA-directed RNA polymerase [Alkalicoccus daliensis]